jgi:tetratricopeptide (TPR) repeat protein
VAERQWASGSYIAQAASGGTAIVAVYQQAPAAPVGEAEQAAAAARLAALPVGTIPVPAPLPAGSRMPVGRSPLFVGRQEDLRRVALALLAGEGAAVGRIAVVTGLGGIGKTQLVNEFAHRYGPYFAGGVFWLNFAVADAIPSEIAACGGPGCLDLRPDFGALPLPDQVRLVASAWHGPLPRLLIFDGCEDEALLAQWRPVTGGSRILATSRRGEWRGDLGVRALPLGVLGRAESVDLLGKHRPDLSRDDPGLAGIAEELGDLPLALHLAGSFLWSYRHAAFGKPAAYLAELRRADLLQHRPMTAGGRRSPAGHDPQVARSFALGYDRLKRSDPIDALGLSLLARAACFAPGEPIPRGLLRASLNLADDQQAALQYEDAIARLVALGLIDQGDDGALVLHRLLGRFLQAATRPRALTDARAAVEAVVLEKAGELNQAGRLVPLLAWQPHLRAVVAGADASGSKRCGPLHNQLGRTLRMAADFQGARAAFARALSIAEQELGNHHPRVAQIVSNLGQALQDLGDLPAARSAYERALAINERASGKDSPEVADEVNNLGTVLRDLGDLAGARRAFERALAINEKTFGAGHERVGSVLGNLGGLLRVLGDLASARQACERALAIAVETSESGHPRLATRLNNLGAVLHDLGDLPGARDAYERALTIDEKAFGPDHPKVAPVVSNLAIVLQDLGDLAGAREAFRRALRGFEALLGPQHPDTLRARASLEGLVDGLGVGDAGVTRSERDKEGWDMEPVTTAILAAIAAGAVSGVGDAAKQAIGDAYSALKALIARKFGSGSAPVEAVSKLEGNPESAGWKESVATELAKAGANQDQELAAAAEQVMAKLQELPPGARQHVMQAIGSYIAQADRGGTAKVIIGGAKE